MDTISLQQLLEIGRLRSGVLPESLAGHLLCAAVWRAAAANAPLRPGMILLDPLEGMRLDLASQDSGARAGEEGYLAPEAAAGNVPANDPQVLVYAAGALGYELFTGRPPLAGPVPRMPELEGAVGGVIRTALAMNRAERFSRLEELNQALQSAHRAPLPEFERLVFAALSTVVLHWPLDDTSRPLALSAQSNQGKVGAGMAQLLTWVSKVDAALERLQKQQLELVLMLASHQVFNESSAARAKADDRNEKIREQLQRIAALPRAAPPPAPEHRTAVPLWLHLGGTIAAGATAALAVSFLTSTQPPDSHGPAQDVIAREQRVESPPPALLAPAPGVPALGVGPPQAAPGEVSGDRALTGAPAPSGGLTAEQVRKKLEENRGALRGCIDEALRRDPNLRVRKIHVATTIAPSGQVTAAEIDDRRVNESPLGTCLKRAMRRIVFPSFAGEPFDVDIPIVLSASDR